METSNPQSIQPLPILSADVPRRLAAGVVVANVAVASIAGAVIGLSGRSDWWPAFTAAAVVCVVCSAGSVILLSKAAGRSMDWLVTFVMAAAAVRMFSSLLGLIIAVKGFGTPADPTAVLICGFFAAALVVESALLNRVLRHTTAFTSTVLTSPAAHVGESHA